MKVLGIDPGSLHCGYALLEDLGGRVPLLREAGIWHLGGSAPLPRRLATLQERLEDLLRTHAPDALCIEESFVHRNVHSAMVLGHARGVAMACCARRDMAVEELSPSEAKKIVAGSGRASKESVAEMCRRLLALESLPVGPDASDALALALASLSRRRSPAHSATSTPKGRFDLDAYLKRIGKA